MSLTTRCPACATTFRVVPDQLKLSDGWVRCGHCADVFDATRYLETWTPPGAETLAGQGSPPDSAPQPIREPLIDASAGNGDSPVPWPEVSEPSDPDMSENGHSPAVAAGVDLNDMSSGNRTENLTESAPDAPAANAEPKWESGLQGNDPLPAQEPRSQAVDMAPLSDSLSEGMVRPPEQDDRDDLDRLLDQVLNEDSPLEAEVSDPSWARLPLTPVDGPGTVAGMHFAVDATPPSQAVGEESTGFQADLQRYAASLKHPELAEDPNREPGSPRQETAFASVPVHLVATDEDLGDGGGLPAGDEPEFVRQARRRAFWQSRTVRGVLLLVALLLAAVLAGQWALHERDRLAAVQPELEPWLVRLCEPLGCQVRPVRDIEAIMIDSSTLVRRLGNFYSFDLVLKNTSSFALAVPALELSLTDTSDIVISRRVFLPEELPGVPALLPAQGSVPVSLRLSLAVGDQLPMAGYRALVFYP